MRKRLDLSRLYHKLPKGILKADAEGNLKAAEPEDFPVEVSGIPAGGDEGQFLGKASDEDRDTGWFDAPTGIPEGGDEGQFLGKASDTSGDIGWITPASGVPDGGHVDEVLAKLSEDNQAIGWKLPEVIADQNVGTVKLWTGTASAYAAIVEKDSNTLYFVIEDTED